MNTGFPWGAEQNAWIRQKMKCAGCGIKLLTFAGKGRTFFAHPLIPFENGGGKTTNNCVFLCTVSPNNCHFRIGHKGDEKSKPCRISMEELPYFNG